MTSDQERLRGLVEAWKVSAEEVLDLLAGLADEDWSRPTDLPGWDVRAVASHLAHIESELSGIPQEPVEVPEVGHLTAATSGWTEVGVVARRSRSGPELVDELRRAVQARYAELLRNPPVDGSTQPPLTPGGMPWDWSTLLSNRVVDVWMHGQDIRRAVGRWGGFDTPGAQHTASVFTHSFGYSVGKRVAPPVGTTVALDVAGANPVHVVLEINEQRRAVPADPRPDVPTVSLAMDLETFVMLAGGRRAPSEVEVQVGGDRELGSRILEAMAVTS